MPKGFLNWLVLSLWLATAVVPAFSVRDVHAAPTVLTGSASPAPATTPARSGNVSILYFPWYGAPPRTPAYDHWDGGDANRPSPRLNITSSSYPALGPYDSIDPLILRAHMSWMKAAGVDLVTVSWWGRGSPEDGNSRAVLDAAASSGLHVNFQIEPYRDRTAQTFVTDIHYLYDAFGTHPAFFRTARPTLYGNSKLQRGLFSVYAPAATPDWSQALDSLRNTAYDAIVLIRSDDGMLFADGDVRAQLALFHSDGLFNFGAYDYIYSGTFPTSSDYILMYAASPGFDNSRSLRTGTPLQVPRRQGAFYDDAWSNLVRQSPEWVLIDSFNEWHESTQIEPASAQSYGGFKYLDYEGHYGLAGTTAELAYIDRTAYWIKQYRQLSSGAYVPLASPVRILETRTNSGISPIGGPGRPFGPGETRTLHIAAPGVPTSGITGAVFNVTVTDATSAGYLTIWPSDQAEAPLASNLNWTPGVTVANLVYVRLSPGGDVNVRHSGGTANVVADLAGYFTSGRAAEGQFRAVAPQRLLDSRVTAAYHLGPGATVKFHIPNALGHSAVVLNVTITDTTSSGYLTVFPAGTSQPTTSNLNWFAGETVPNRVTVRVGATGEVALFNAAGEANVVVDLNGYYTDSTATAGVGASYFPLPPTRILDTRNGDPPLGPGVSRSIVVAGFGGVPRTARAAVLNVTVTDTTAGSYLTVWPDGVGRPLASDLDWAPSKTVANLVVVQLINGKADMYNLSGNAAVVVDVVGYFGW